MQIEINRENGVEGTIFFSQKDLNRVDGLEEHLLSNDFQGLFVFLSVLLSSLSSGLFFCSFLSEVCVCEREREREPPLS